MKIDEKKAEELYQSLKANINSWAAENGLDISKFGFRWGEGDFKLSLKCDLISFNGETEEQVALEKLTNFKKGDEIMVDNELYTIIGYSPRSKVYPLLVERIKDKKQLKMNKEISWNAERHDKVRNLWVHEGLK
tara:strand:+ start:2149 stop:2550 length:402 start_codon:yes stop_codon:yes gene_type:complete